MILDLPSEEVIYHYTNFNALESILRGSSLWLSHLSCLNDVSEGAHGIREIIKHIKSTPLNTQYSSLLDELLDSMEYAIKQDGYYVVSFCKGGDLLSQWRAYAGDGCGVAIGINIKSLKNIIDPESSYLIGSCRYHSKEYPYVFNQIFRQYAPNGLNNDNYSGLVILAITSIFLKHEGFYEENEYRIAAPPSVDKKYRNVSGRIIPYHQMSLGQDYSWLKEIVIGPCHQQIAIGKAIEVVLSELNIDVKDKIVYSQIPYRGLRYY